MARDHDPVAGLRRKGSAAGLSFCIGLSVLIHVVVLGVSPKTTSVAASRGHDGNNVVLSASLVTARVPAAQSNIGDSTKPEPATALPIPAPETPASPREEIAALVAHTTGGDATVRDYFLPNELTVHPHIALDIDGSSPVLPDGEENAVAHNAKLRLLIDRQGNVDGVITEASDMPPAMLSAIVERFYAAKFVPGFILGFAVNSQMLAEVVVEPPPAPSSTVGPTPGPTAALAGPTYN